MNRVNALGIAGSYCGGLMEFSDCVALSLFHDPKDPESFTETKVGDKQILDMTRRIRLLVDSEIEKKGWDRAARVTVTLRAGRIHLSALPIRKCFSRELCALRL